MKRSQARALPLAVLVLAVVAALGLTGCTGGTTLQGSDRDAVLTYSEPIAENLLQGMNAGDYAAFSRDFNTQMLQGIPASTFTTNIVTNIGGKLGKYVSRQVSSVTQIGANILIIYTAKFEKDANVTVRLSLEQAAPHHVAGLYFNSPALSQ